MLVGNLSATGVLAAVGDAPHVHVDVHGGSATIAAERLPVTRAHSLLSRIAALVDVEARIIRPLKSVRPVLKPSAIVTGALLRDEQVAIVLPLCCILPLLYVVFSALFLTFPSYLLPR